MLKILSFSHKSQINNINMNIKIYTFKVIIISFEITDNSLRSLEFF
jgi:hypothetical protein